MLLFDDGVRRLTVRYVEMRRGVFFYKRRYPRDLQHHYPGNGVKLLSLKTKDKDEAGKRALEQAKKDNAEWAVIRKARERGEQLVPEETTRLAEARLSQIGAPPGSPVDPDDDPLLDYLHSTFAEAAEQHRNPDTGEYPEWKQIVDAVTLEMIRIRSGQPAPKRLSDALAHYLKEHTRGQQKKFAADNTRSINWVIDLLGDRPLGDYTRVEALSVRDAIQASGVKTQTVRKQMTQIAAIFKKGIRDFELPIVRHAFENIPILGLGEDSKRKETFSDAELQQIAASSRQGDDALQQIAAMLVNTGARISEVVGLKVADLRIDHQVPHVIIQPHGSVRTLKTKGSRRAVPLVGISLWAARRALQAAKDAKSTEWLFARYVGLNRAGEFGVKNNSASVAVNDWIERTIGSPKTSHGFRHSLRDRLRASGAPLEIQDVIGGWSSKTIGQQYGEGYGLEKLARYLAAVSID